MAALPKVAVTRWENVSGEQIEAYWRRLREAGLAPVDACAPGLSFKDCAGLVLTGGVDVDPRRYGEERGAHTQTPNPARDQFESRLLLEALDAGLPVLTICRGYQLLNVCLGGRLLQHVETGDHASQQDEQRTSRTHPVQLQPESRLREWLLADALTVNSRHHQAVTPASLAPGLRVAALSQDGLVEAVESERHAWVVGVQWHPEREEPQLSGFAAASRRLFDVFTLAIRER